MKNEFKMNKGNHQYYLALKEARKDNADLKFVKDNLEKSYEKGNPNSAYALATWYLHGKYFKKNYKKAVELLTYAADHNHLDAIFDLAICFEKGAGIKKDKEKAFMLYLKLAISGSTESYYEVGRCYYYGIGVKKNIEIANLWLDKSEKKDNKKVKNRSGAKLQLCAQISKQSVLQQSNKGNHTLIR